MEDFHTYFVGEAGVWVHNASRYICEQWFTEYMGFKKRANGDHWKAIDDAISAKKAALNAQGAKLQKHQTNSVYNEVLADYLDEGGDLTKVPDLPNAKPHELPIDKAFREQHGRKVGGHWSEGDPDLPAGKKKTKGFQSKPGETPAQLETRIKNELENAFEKRTKGQGLDEVVIDKTSIPDATDEIVTNAIERAVGNKGVNGVKYWIFDGTNLV